MQITVIGSKKHRSFAIVTLVFLAAMFATALFAAGNPRGNDASYASKPVAFARTERGVYAVICRGIGTRATRTPALEMFEGFGVKAVFFIKADVLESNAEAAKEIALRGHALGLDCGGTYGMSKSEFLRWLAAQNDRFFDATGRRPKYCLAGETACVHARDACATYGQYCVTSATDVKNGSEIIKKGDIVQCCVENEKTLYAFAQAASSAAASGLAPCSLKELLEEHEEGVFY